jgi:SAM-dependent methyltransferase
MSFPSDGGLDSPYQIRCLSVNNAVDFHSQTAGKWESNYRKKAFLARRSVLKELLASCNLGGQYWLDAGCGTGTLTRFLTEYKGCRVLGVDASKAMISNCTPTAGAEFRQIDDICHTGLPNAAFDGVLCSSVLEYVSDAQAALIELRRLLKQNGLLVISVPNRTSLAWWPIFGLYRLTKHLGPCRVYEYLDYSKNRYSELGFRCLLRSLGLRVDMIQKYGGMRRFPVLGQDTLMMFRAIKLSQSSV